MSAATPARAVIQTWKPRIPDARFVGTLALLDQNHDHRTKIDGDYFGDFAQKLGEARICLLPNVCGQTEQTQVQCRENINVSVHMQPDDEHVIALALTFIRNARPTLQTLSLHDAITQETPPFCESDSIKKRPPRNSGKCSSKLRSGTESRTLIQLTTSCRT